MTSAVRRAHRAALAYRERWGWNPLPSRRLTASDRRKRPIGPYAHLWDTPGDLDAWPDTPNLQLMTGVRWGLAVIDLDGEAGVRAWQSLSLFRPAPRTWTVRTPSGNWHLWFSVPAGVAELPKRRLWEGGRHEAVELLGDRSLVMAPPSVDLGRRYEFVVGPRDLARPSDLPRWVVGPGIVPRPVFVPSPVLGRRMPPPYRGHRDVPAILSAIPNKANLAFGWGLRLTGRRCKSGWLECRALGRPDLSPSAGFHPESGFYCEPSVFRLSLFELAVALGRYGSWQECCDDLERRYLGEKVA